MLGLGREPKPPSFPRMRESNPVILAKAGIQPSSFSRMRESNPPSFPRMRESNPPSFPRMRESIKVSNNPQKGADNRQNPNAPINIQQLHQPAE